MPEETTWAKPNTGDDFLIAMGAVVYWSGQVEGRLFWLVAAMLDSTYDGYLDPDERAIAATSGLGFTPLAVLFLRLLNLRGKDSHLEIRETLKEAEAAMRERNRLVHGEWWDDELPLGFTHRTWRAIKIVDAEVSELTELATRLSEIVGRMASARDEIFAR